MIKQTVCPDCGGLLRAESHGWICNKCKGFIGLLDGKFYEYVEKPFAPPMTNADRIRNMSDEELVAFIGHNCLCGRIQDEGTWCEEQGVCEGCLLKWLKQPADDLPEITEQTMDAIKKMGEKAHGGE